MLGLLARIKEGLRTIEIESTKNRFKELCEDSQKYWNKNNFDKAEKKLLEALSLDLEYIDAISKSNCYYELGRIYFRKNFPNDDTNLNSRNLIENSEKCFKSAIAYNADESKYYLSLAYLYFRSERFADSMENYNIVKNMPHDLNDIVLQNSLDRCKKNIDLLSKFKKLNALIISSPKSPDNYFERALIKTTFSDSPRSALDDLKKAIDLDPKNPKYHNAYGETLVKLAKYLDKEYDWYGSLDTYRLALKSFETALKFDSNNESFKINYNNNLKTINCKIGINLQIAEEHSRKEHLHPDFNSAPKQIYAGYQRGFIDIQ